MFLKTWISLVLVLHGFSAFAVFSFPEEDQSSCAFWISLLDDISMWERVIVDIRNNASDDYQPDVRDMQRKIHLLRQRVIDNANKGK